MFTRCVRWLVDVLIPSMPRCVVDWRGAVATWTAPLLEPLDWNLSALTLGYYEALVHANVPTHLYELALGVQLALTVADAEARWFAGEDVLRPALIRDADALLRILGAEGAGCGDGTYVTTAPDDELTDGA